MSSIRWGARAVRLDEEQEVEGFGGGVVEGGFGHCVGQCVAFWSFI